jgi:hypothetical protein
VFTLVRISVLAAWVTALVDKKQEYTKREGSLASLRQIATLNIAVSSQAAKGAPILL